MVAAILSLLLLGPTLQWGNMRKKRHGNRRLWVETKSIWADSLSSRLASGCRPKANVTRRCWRAENILEFGMVWFLKIEWFHRVSPKSVTVMREKSQKKGTSKFQMRSLHSYLQVTWNSGVATRWASWMAMAPTACWCDKHLEVSEEVCKAWREKVLAKVEKICGSDLGMFEVQLRLDLYSSTVLSFE